MGMMLASSTGLGNSVNMQGLHESAIPEEQLEAARTVVRLIAYQGSEGRRPGVFIMLRHPPVLLHWKVLRHPLRKILPEEKHEHLEQFVVPQSVQMKTIRQVHSS